MPQSHLKNIFGKEFIRERDGTAPNNLLNYGYAILRTQICRAIMNSGLLPIIGVFHKNYYNSFPLADDIMEPYRPFIDKKVYELTNRRIKEIDKTVKAKFLEMFYDELKYHQFTSTTRSLAQIFVGDADNLWFPTL